MFVIKTFEKKRMGELLVEAGMVSQAQVEEVIQLQKGSPQKIGEIIVEKGWAMEKDVVEMLAFQLGVPYVDLRRYTIDQEAAGLISESLAKRYVLIPLCFENSLLKVAMWNPLNIFALEDLKLMAGMDIESVIATATDIHHAINRVYSVGKTKEIAKQFKEQWQDETLNMNQLEEEMIHDITNAPIVKLFDMILDQAISKGASDIHIEPMETYVRIRLRVDGEMIELLRTGIRVIHALTTRIKILSDLDIAERRLPQDGRIQRTKYKQEMDLRVSILPTIHGEKTVIRILYRTGMCFSINQLEFHPEDELKVRSMLKIPHGIILATGPTGSGKSTTLATAIRELNTPNINIITVEDPVENLIEGINQVPINTKAGFTFASALRAILRQDPDVMMVGEMRDFETSEIAIRSAITGHLVLSTLHTNDVSSSITRLIDMGCESYMIGACVRGIIAQRLVRKICPDCKEESAMTEEEHKLTQIPQGTIVYQGTGCQNCNQTGYKGRMGVYEILIVDADIQKIISKNQFTSEQLKEESIQKGMRTLQDNARWNVVRGYTTVREMLRISYEL